MSSEKHLWWRISALPVEFCNEPQIFPIFNLLFLRLYFQTYSILLLLVAKIGVSLLMQTSLQTFWRWKLYKSPLQKKQKVFPADEFRTSSKILEKDYFCLVCSNPGVLINCWVTKSMIYMFQWFQYKCLPTVCWPYYDGVSEFPPAKCEKISKSIILVNSVVL